MGLKVLFVLPDVRPELYYHTGSVFESIAYMSAFLKRNGHQVTKFQPTTPVPVEPLLEAIEREKPDVVAYSAVTNMIKYVERWAPGVKAKYPHLFTVCGGVHATSAGDATIAIEGIDSICIGEGEIAFTELCDRLADGRDYLDIPSLWFKTQNGIVKNPTGKLPPTLDDYPFPDLDLFKIEETFYYKNRFATMKLSRGCPLPCTYCCNKMFMDVYPSNYVRYRTPQKSVDYIKEYLRRYPNIDAIAFLDDILPMKPDWFREFAKLYREQVGLPYTSRCLVNVFKNDVAQLLAESGCYEVTFGVESGNEAYRIKALKRRQMDAQLIKAFHDCHAHGITTRANMMVGLPHETMPEILSGIELCSKLDTRFILVSTFFPTPATELYDVCLRDGLIDKDSEIPDSPYNMGTALKQTSVRPEQVEFARANYTNLVRLYAMLPERYHPRLSHLLNQDWFPYNFFIGAQRVAEFVNKQWTLVKLKFHMKHQRYTPKKLKVQAMSPTAETQPAGPRQGHDQPKAWQPEAAAEAPLASELIPLVVRPRQDAAQLSAPMNLMRE
jgi:anaerobic magnesium-protoporphyrin IX monomethyl ester cyclase